MHRKPNVYSLCHSQRVGFLSLIENAVNQEEINKIKLEKNFILRLYMDELSGLNSIPVPKMLLSKGHFTDFIWTGIGLLMFSKHVLDAFEGELEKHGEIYPVECDAGPYYLY